MAISQEDILEVKNKMASLLGQKLLIVTVDDDGIFHFEFGTEVIPIRQNESLSENQLAPENGGKWHLSIDLCAWRIERDNILLAGSSDEEPHLEAVLKELEGKTLISVDLFQPLWDTLFSFEGGFSLHTFSVSSEGEVHWLLFFSDGHVLNIGPGTSWSYDRNTEPHLDPGVTHS